MPPDLMEDVDDQGTAVTPTLEALFLTERPLPFASERMLEVLHRTR